MSGADNRRLLSFAMLKADRKRIDTEQQAAREGACLDLFIGRFGTASFHGA